MAGIEKIARESDTYPNYEGRTGASPREMKLVIMNAAQSARYECLSPFAVFDELEELVRGRDRLRVPEAGAAAGRFPREPQVHLPGARQADRSASTTRCGPRWASSRSARYIERFERYVAHVSYWVKKEKVPNPITGRDEDPDEEMMAEIERILQMAGRRDEFRREVISRIGAWSIDHPRQKPDYEPIFPRPIAELRASFFDERKKQVRKINEDLLVLLTDGPRACRPDAATAAGNTLATMKSRFGYCDDCAKDAILALVRKRYS